MNLEQEELDLFRELEQAIYDSDLDKVQELVNRGVHLDFPYLGDDQTPLALACELGKIAIVQALLDAGADVNQRMGEEGETALLFALSPEDEESSMLEIVHLLVEAGAEIEIESYQGDTPLSVADRLVNQGQNYQVVADYFHQVLANRGIENA